MEIQPHEISRIARLYHSIELGLSLLNAAAFEGPNGLAAQENSYAYLRETLMPEFMKLPADVRTSLIPPSRLEEIMRRLQLP